MANDRADTTPKTDQNTTESRASKTETEIETGNGAAGSGEPDFSIGPNAEYYVTRPDDLFTRLQRFIATSSGGVFGLTGVRGAGKSVLLKRIEKEFEGKHHTLHIPAPVSSSEEAAFFAMLFRQLCGSVITYIDQKVFKKKTGSERRGREEFRKRLYIILIFLPVLAAGCYGGWFYWTFYSDHQTQEQILLREFSKELESLKLVHANGVASIVSAVEEGILAAAESDFQDEVKKPEKAEREAKKAQQEVKKAQQKVGDVDEQLGFLDTLYIWEGQFRDEFAFWSKAIGDMPHPAHVLYFDEKRLKDGPFSLESFLIGRGSSLGDFKEYDFSLSQGEGLLTTFREETREWTQREVSKQWIGDLVTGGKDSFFDIQQRLMKVISLVESELDSARTTLQDKEKGLIAARDTLNEKREIAADLAGEATRRVFDGAILKARNEEAKIRNLAKPVENAIFGLETYAEAIAFDPWSLDTWRNPLLPAERHENLSSNLSGTIDNTRNTFIIAVNENITALNIKGLSPTVWVQYSDNSKQALRFLSDTLGRIKRSDMGFYRLRTLGIGPLVLVGLAVGVGLVLVFFLFLGWKFREAQKHGDVLGLLRRSEDIIRSLEYEVTQSRGSTLDLSLFQRLGASFSLSEEQRGRTLTLPGLTARYIEYIHDVQRVLGAKYHSPKLIICIDELDKITDPKQVGNVLREIKGALYEKDCFYLLSISEDAVRAFEGRLVEERDIFESTFDEILFLERLDLETCLSIARRRCEDAGYGPNEKVVPDIQEAMEIAAVLSTGVPRELLRNLRAVENTAGRVLNFEPSLAWHTLFRRKLRDILKKVRTSNGLDHVRADLIDEIEDYLGWCHRGYDENAVRDSLSRVREGTNALTSQSAALQTEADTVDREKRAAALELDTQLIRAWIRCWMELEIHLFVRLCSLSYATVDSRIRSGAYAELLEAYAGLPYSIEATARRLSKFRFPGGRAVAE